MVDILCGVVKQNKQTEISLNFKYFLCFRFLRRLELSLKRKDRVTSPSESLESGEDSPRATSPLLQPTKEPRPEIRKSSSIGKLHANFNQSNVKAKRGRYKRGGELLIPQDENNWKRVVITGNGYSD